MKILSIGNSFSQDAHKWLHQVAESAGEGILAVNLYIGGCSLQTHFEHLLDKEPAYDLEINGKFSKKISLTDALNSDNWDIITMQQVSHLSGKYQTFEPYLTDLYKIVKATNPNAKVYLHKTWAYETGYNGLLDYGGIQNDMYNKICEAYNVASEKLSCGVIPVGDVIQNLRKNVEYFDYANGGESLTRDGYHLSLIYGRYAAAVTWFAYLCKADPEKVKFIPSTEELKADENILKIINKTVKEVINSKA